MKMFLWLWLFLNSVCTLYFFESVNSLKPSTLTETFHSTKACWYSVLTIPSQLNFKGSLGCFFQAVTTLGTVASPPCILLVAMASDRANVDMCCCIIIYLLNMLLFACMVASMLLYACIFASLFITRSIHITLKQRTGVYNSLHR